MRDPSFEKLPILLKIRGSAMMHPGSAAVAAPVSDAIRQRIRMHL